MANSPLWQKILVAVLLLAVLAYYGWNYFIGPKLKVTKIARRNIKRAMPELQPAAIENIIIGIWENLGPILT